VTQVQWLYAPRFSRVLGCKARTTRQRTPEGSKALIETCDLKGANRTVVVPGSDLYLRDLCWLPDGRIVYSCDEPHSINEGDLWQIGVYGQTGAPTSKPKRITDWVGSHITQLVASEDGKRLTFLKQAFQQQVYLGQLAAGGTRMNPPRLLTNDEGSASPTAWTAHSKAVLFWSDRNGTRGIFKQGIGQETPSL
jgi:Tol biopolymer transport system component